MGTVNRSADSGRLRCVWSVMFTFETYLPLVLMKNHDVLRSRHLFTSCHSAGKMSITYPPELLPVAAPGDEAEVLVCDGASVWKVTPANRGNQPGTNYPAFVGIPSINGPKFS